MNSYDHIFFSPVIFEIIEYNPSISYSFTKKSHRCRSLRDFALWLHHLVVQSFLQLASLSREAAEGDGHCHEEGAGDGKEHGAGPGGVGEDAVLIDYF